MSWVDLRLVAARSKALADFLAGLPVPLPGERAAALGKMAVALAAAVVGESARPAFGERAAKRSNFPTAAILALSRQNINQLDNYLHEYNACLFTFLFKLIHKDYGLIKFVFKKLIEIIEGKVDMEKRKLINN